MRREGLLKRLPGASVSRFLPPAWPQMHLRGVEGLTVPQKSGEKSCSRLGPGLAKSGKPAAREWVPSTPRTGDPRPLLGTLVGGMGLTTGSTRPAPLVPPPPPPAPSPRYSQRLGEGAEPLGHSSQPLPGAVHPTVAVAAAGRRAERRRCAAGLGRAAQPQGEEAE